MSFASRPLFLQQTQLQPALSSLIRSIVFLVFICCLLDPRLHAQGSIYTSSAQTVTNETMTPTPGGHDYIHLLSETVSPSNGSVSYRLDYPMPKGRGLNFPYYYGSNSTLFRLMFQWNNTLIWVPNYSSFSSPVPSVSYQISTYPSQTYQCGPQPSNTCMTWPCNVATGFTFTGPDGTSHNLGIGAIAPQGVPSPPHPPGG